MEVIETPDSNYLDGWVNTFGNIVYIWRSNAFEHSDSLYKTDMYAWASINTEW